MKGGGGSWEEATPGGLGMVAVTGGDGQGQA